MRPDELRDEVLTEPDRSGPSFVITPMLGNHSRNVRTCRRVGGHRRPETRMRRLAVMPYQLL